MKVFLAGATGVIGSRLALLLRDAKHDVTGTTRDPAKVSRLQALGIKPVAVDAFDADAMARSVASTEPDVVIHQLTDLPSAPGTPGYAVGQEANRRLRIEGTRNLVRAAAMAGVRRVIAQSIAFAYAPGEGVRNEGDPLDVNAESPRRLTVQGIVALEREVLQTPGIAGVVLRYGYFYGPGTWYGAPPKSPSVHADAAAYAALLSLKKGNGVYNIAENDGAVSSAKAERELGFDPAFRISTRLAQEMAGSS
ncbi:NAD-dependent epimerase/dehydratase family protein [Bradyrhizobium sp.]|jgi:nucleoside-diphosphate-sugar epimerase|uniref:NAD-dependent epimerase/dehydratase family protein n=1 Tax=Bradyrhizobium sp. TaxID=376 RepID=UPI003BB045F6